MSETPLIDEIGSVIRKRLYPLALMRYMEGLEKAEKAGRIRKSGNSAMRYALEAFLRTQIAVDIESSLDWRLYVEAMDDSAGIKAVEKQAVEKQAGIAGSLVQEGVCYYPDWLIDFFEEDINFDLLLPGNDDDLAEAAQRIHEWCWKHPTYKMLVASQPATPIV